MRLQKNMQKRSKDILKQLVADDLKRMQSWELSEKIKHTKLLIREWYEHFNGNVAVSFSGGKIVLYY